MSFNVAASAYDRYMGRFSEPLAVPFADFAQVVAPARALDVGCGPGALTDVLVQRLGGDQVSAVDPSEPFVAAARERFPGLDVQSAPAEHLPFPDGSFDLALAELVVHFMSDPVAGLAEMARVTRPGGIVAACVWDHGGATGPLSTFWQAAHAVDSAAPDESELAGSREGHLADLFDAAGLAGIESGVVQVGVNFATFEEWWEPFTLGVGPGGAYVAGLDEERRERLRVTCADLLPAPFRVDAAAWAARGCA